MMLMLALAGPTATLAAETNDLGTRQREVSAAAEGRLLVRFKDADSQGRSKPVADRVGGLSQRMRLPLTSLREFGANLQLVAVDDRTQPLASIAAQLRDDPEVEAVALDRRRFAHALPNDPSYAGQWYLQATQAAAIRAEGAWDRSKGSSGLVIAVLDTGVRFDHPDLGRASQGGKLFPGYDFVSADGNGGFLVANDGNGWDPDPSDPGDWVTSSDAANAQFKGCKVGDSSWHGTRTAGMIAAATNNAVGIAGVNWNAWLLPVRVLGKCGGYDSDIIAAMRWAAGLHVNGVPDNPYPARVINMSLGNTDTSQCQIYRPVINELAARGVLVVASAGNEGGRVDEPADCPGVLGVAGLRHAGTKVGYSNLGPQIGIAAPAGNCFNTNGGPCLYSLDTTTNHGATVPGASGYTDQTNFNLGTSFSAPQAAGVAALMLAVNGKLDATELKLRMQRGARTFPTPVRDDAGNPLTVCHVPAGATDLQTSECVCTTQVCGAGMLSASGAMSEAARPIISIVPSAGIAPGSTVTFDSSGSVAACGHSLSARAWSAVDGAGQAVALSSADQASVSLTAPSSGAIALTLLLTDDAGAQQSASVTLGSSTAGRIVPTSVATAACPVAIKIETATGSSTPPAKASGGGGGGGRMDLAMSMLLLSWVTFCAWRRHRLQCSHEFQRRGQRPHRDPGFPS